MKNFNRLTALWILLYPVTFIGQEQTTFTLAEAEEYAVNHSLKVTNAALEMEIAQKKIWETTAMGLPQVNIDGSFQHLVFIPTTVVDASIFNPSAPAGEVLAFQMGQKFTMSGALNVSQLLFDGSYFVGLQFAKFYKNMSAMQTEFTKQEVKQLTREAFYQLLVARKNIELLDSLIPVTQRLYDQAKAISEAGLTNSEPADQLMLALNRVKATRTGAERQIELAEALLKMQMGFDQEKEITISGTFDDLLAEIQPLMASVQPPAVTNNAGYQLLEQQQTTNAFLLKSQKATYLPTLAAFFTHSQNAYRNQFSFLNDEDWYPTTIWGVSLKVPVTSAGAKIARVKQTEIKLEQTGNSLENLQANLEFAALRIQLSLKDALGSMKIEQMNVDLAQKLYANSISRENIGTASAMMATQLQAQVLSAQGNYIAAVMKLFMLKIEMDKLYNQ